MICGWVRAIEGVELYGWVAHVEVRSAAAEVCRNGGGSGQLGERVKPNRGFAIEINLGVDVAAGSLRTFASVESRWAGRRRPERRGRSAHPAGE